VLIGLSPLDAATAGGYPTNALRLSTVTDTLPGLDALSYATRTGAVVVRTYKIANRGEATVDRVAVHDPDAGGLVGCGPDGRGTLDLAAWSSVTCTVRFAAVAGAHRTEVVAAGMVDGVGRSVSASADAGYFAATPRLRLSESLGLRADAGSRMTPREAVTVPIGAVLHATYTLSNDGGVALVDVSVTDTQPVTGLNCGAVAPKISVLPPAASVVCTAVLRAAAGLRNGSAEAIGTEPERSISASGPGAPTGVEVVAYSTYTGSRGPLPAGLSIPSASGSGLPTSSANVAYVGALPPIMVGGGQAAVHTARTAPPGAQGPSVGSSGGRHSLPTLVRRHRRAFSVLMILLIVALVPAVRYLLRRT
jgi:hypothetical protein